MRKLFACVLALMMALSAVPVMAAELKDISGLEQGTYIVELVDGATSGYLTIANADGEVEECLVLVGEDYGYVYIDKTYNGKTYDFKNVELRLLDAEDLGVSGWQVYFIGEHRSYDPLIDLDYCPIGSDVDFLETDELPYVDVEDDCHCFDEIPVDIRPKHWGKCVGDIIYIDMDSLSEEDIEAMFN